MISKVKLGSPDEVFSSLEPAKLCRWVGELFLELHQGTYTSQARMKGLNRECEGALRQAEFLQAVLLALAPSRKYPQLELERLWKILLLNQFHDVLPGTSIAEVHKDALFYFSEVLKGARALQQGAVLELFGPPVLGEKKEVEKSDEEVILINSLSWPRTELIPLCPEDGAGDKEVLAAHTVIPMGYKLLRNAAPIDIPAPLSAEHRSDGTFHIRSHLLQVVLDSQGRLTSLRLTRESGLDLATGQPYTAVRPPDTVREAIAPGCLANQLVLFDDIPLYWDAWDVMDYHLQTRRTAITEEPLMAQYWLRKALVVMEFGWCSAPEQEARGLESCRDGQGNNSASGVERAELLEGMGLDEGGLDTGPCLLFLDVFGSRFFRVLVIGFGLGVRWRAAWSSLVCGQQEHPQGAPACLPGHQFYADSLRVCVLKPLKFVEVTPLRVSLKFRAKLGSHSRISQKIVIDAVHPYVLFDTRITWGETHKFLKVEFPVNVLAPHATYDIQFGHVQRPTHFNTSWDSARFEGQDPHGKSPDGDSLRLKGMLQRQQDGLDLIGAIWFKWEAVLLVWGHKWMDLSEHDWGVALINTSKYGYSCHGNVMRLSLLRAPKSPDPHADQGEHRIVYALMPHYSTFQQAGVIQQAYQLHCPVQLHRTPSSAPRALPLDICHFFSWFQISTPAVIIDTIKKAEDRAGCLCMRLHEAYGSRVTAVLRSTLPLSKVILCNGYEDVAEDPSSRLDWRDGSVKLSFTPFQILSLLLYSDV
ncbi:MAN2C1 [Cordylochernes scorpioides]|uniref:MAN2C1 n=1 Tax=Cordylochernes scorpioides TaxID=51811 RepID=A0ABY6JZ15_9ARAC|nr:MAN2C1 [Cordylochernes scorpioides]